MQQYNIKETFPTKLIRLSRIGFVGLFYFVIFRYGIIRVINDFNNSVYIDAVLTSFIILAPVCLLTIFTIDTILFSRIMAFDENGVTIKKYSLFPEYVTKENIISVFQRNNAFFTGRYVLIITTRNMKTTSYSVINEPSANLVYHFKRMGIPYEYSGRVLPFD